MPVRGLRELGGGDGTLAEDHQGVVVLFVRRVSAEKDILYRWPVPLLYGVGDSHLQLGGSEGLGDEGVGPRLESGDDILLISSRSEDEDGEGAELRRTAQLLDEFDAVHDRHAPIREHQVHS
jgi:hypothetical protein